MSKLIAYLKSVWSSLPHQVQALILLFLTTALTTLGKELQELFLGNEIASVLGVKRRTVKMHMNRLFARFEIGDGIKRVKLAMLLSGVSLGKISIPQPWKPDPGRAEEVRI